MHKQFWHENMKRKVYLDDLEIGGKIILKWENVEQIRVTQ
jgi:hypothetical protein